MDESDDISETQIDINLTGVILGCKLALPRMIRRGSGHIVNVSSMAGMVPIPGLAVYCATKFAVVGLTKTLREEYRDTGINFSTIMPCKVTTELALGSDEAAKGVPTSTPEEIAAAVLKSIAHELTEVTIPSYLGYSPAILNLTPFS
ncbi:SDR family NAD(P)-dependent oxidoreductase [Oleiphilus messinensis]|nr:SDR family NAD(P)-dependent oxidoreductase [Oleiphilus messinensis]